MNRFLATVQWLAADAAGTTYTVNLPAGFNLKLVQVEWCGLQSASDAASEAVTERRGIGWCSGTSARRCIGTRSTDASASSDCGNVARDDAVCATHSGAGTTDGLLDITTFGASDQLIFTVDDQVPANITVFIKCWGGTEVSAGVGDFAEPAATGDQTYTATGFVSGGTDQAVFAAFCQATAAINTSTPNVDSGLSIGYGDGTTSVFIMGNSDEASGTMDTDGAGQSGAILGMCTAGGSSTLNSLANLTGFGTDQFTLNWSATANTARKGIYAYLKGCAVKVGEYTIAGNSASATATVSGLSFAPKLAVFIGRMATESAGTAGNNDRLSVGGATSASDRHAWGILDEDATASSNSEINTVLEYDSMLAFPSTGGALLASYDINAWNSDGWQEIVDNAGGVASEWRGYIAFGDAGGSVYNESISESATAADSVAGAAALVGALSEAAAAAESVAALLQAIAALSESGSAADSMVGGLAFDGELAEPASAADSLAGAVTVPGVLAEAAVASDSISAALEAAGVLSEAGAAADVIASLAVLVAALSETGSAADSLTSLGAIYEVSIAEAAAAADIVNAALAAAAAVNEAAAAADSLAGSMIAAGALSESAAVIDSVAGALSIPGQLSESGSGADSLATSLAREGGLSEAGTATDSMASLAVLQASLSELVTALDTLTSAGVLSVAIVEVATAADSLTASTSSRGAGTIERMVEVRFADRTVRIDSTGRAVEVRFADRTVRLDSEGRIISVAPVTRTIH